MARDYTKYTVDGLGENLNKRQLVFTIVKDWSAKNKPSLEDVQKTFPDEIQGSKGFVVKLSEVKDAKRFNMQEPLSIKNGTKVVVSNQWGDNISNLIAVAEDLGYSISSDGEAEEESPLNAEQIAKFKAEEADIYADPDYYAEWNAFSLYDDLLEAGDTAWADRILQKIEDAADGFSTLETVCEKLQERNETEQLLATAKKGEALAKDTSNYTSLANIISKEDKDWALKLYQKAEELAKDFSDLNSIGDALADELGDKENALRVQRKAMALIDDDDEWDKKYFLKSLEDLGEMGESLLAEYRSKPVSNISESFPFSIKNLDTTEIRNHIEKLILSKDEENCKLFKKSTIDFVNSNNSCYWIIPLIQRCLMDFQGKSDDENLDWDKLIDLMYPAGKELDVNPKKEYSLFYCWRSQTFKLDEDKDEEQEFFEILIKHFSDAQNIDDTGDDFYHKCITTLYCTICKMCQEDIAQDELVDLLLTVFNDQYLKDAEQGDFIWCVISETLTSLGVDLDEYKDESNLWREMYLVNFDDVATYLIENDVFDNDYIPS
ncbi:hypothetical protein N9D29_00090 [Flavobacteriaceae bacterium]|nr:hypothetical protein [Flavobacteriaceae bacterium]